MIQILRAAARFTQATSLFRSATVQKKWGPLSNSVAACRLDLYLSSRNFSGLGCEVKQWGLSNSVATKGGNIHSTPAPFRIQCRNKSRVRFEYAPKERRNRQDHYRRLLAAKYELDRRLYKALWKNENLPGHIREDARLKLRKLPRNSSFTRIRNRCILTGRPRAVYRKFRMSRLCFRELAREGALLGIRKASW